MAAKMAFSSNSTQFCTYKSFFHRHTFNNNKNRSLTEVDVKSGDRKNSFYNARCVQDIVMSIKNAFSLNTNKWQKLRKAMSQQDTTKSTIHSFWMGVQCNIAISMLYLFYRSEGFFKFHIREADIQLSINLLRLHVWFTIRLLMKKMIISYSCKLQEISVWTFLINQ